MSVTEAMVSCFREGNLGGMVEVLEGCDDGERPRAIGLLYEALEQLDLNDFEGLPGWLTIAERLAAEAPDAGAPDQAHLAVMQCLRRLGRFDAAIDFARQHLDRSGVLADVYHLACLQGRRELAAELAPHLPGSNVGERLCQAADRLLDTGTVPAARVALELARGAMASGGPLPEAAILAGRAALIAGELEVCAALSREASERFPGHPELVSNNLGAVARLGDAAALEEVRPLARAAIEASDDEDDRWRLIEGLLEAELAAGTPESARAAAEELVLGTDDLPMLARCVAARALARAGNPGAAEALIQTGISQTEADHVAVHRARAEVAWARGDELAAQGAMCAAVFKQREKGTGVEALAGDPAFVTVEGDIDHGSPVPPRPRRLPEGARWIEDDIMGKGWVLGEIDDEGRRQGRYRWFRPDGTICCENLFVDDKAEGEWKRFHDNGEVSGEGQNLDGRLHGPRRWIACDVTTSELMHVGGVSTSVRVSEMDYLHDTVVGIRHFDGQGNRIQASGEPYPEHPEGVPADADWIADKGRWCRGIMAVDDSLNRNARRVGTWRWWNPEGTLVREEVYEAGKRHGTCRAFSDGGELLFEASYVEGKAQGTERYYRRGGDEHERFPVAGARVRRAEKVAGTHVWRYYDAEDQETSVDGTPLAELPGLHPGLGSYFDDIAAIDWSSLEDAGGAADFVPAILRDLLAVDEDEDETITSAVFRDLYWHLCHQGTVYSATAAAMPLLVRLIAYDGYRDRVPLINFVRNAVAGAPRHVVEDADPDSAFAATYRAFTGSAPALLPLLEAGDPALRAHAAAVLAGLYERGSEITAALASRLETESDATARSSMLFSIGRLGTADGLGLLDSFRERPGLDGISAAAACVIARGTEVAGAVKERLLRGFAEAEPLDPAWQASPWADNPLVVEIGCALNAAGVMHQVGVELANDFDRVDAPEKLGLVAGAIWMAMPDEGGMSPELARVLNTVADTESLWRFDRLPALLDQMGFPDDRAALLELARQQST